MPSNNPEYQRTYVRKHYQANKEYYKMKNKQRRESISQEQKMFEGVRTRARANNIPFDIDVSDIIIPVTCPVFGTKIIIGDSVYGPSIDRVVPELGYTKGNIAIISMRANKIKNDASIDEIKKLYDWLKEIGARGET